jgi:penicillin-binding protein 1A
MENAYADVPSLAFKIPESIKLLPIEPRTGNITSSSNVMEAFKINDIPVNYQENDQAEDIFNNIPKEKDISEEIY